MVKTSRGDTCVQIGRVENGEIGSLGIDNTWHNDHLFHVISPKDDPADQCGATDGAGYGYLSGDILGEQASANIYHQHQGSGRTEQGCRLPQYMSVFSLRHLPGHLKAAPTRPGCPADAGRVVFYGLLGPDAVSVTYRTPDGGLATERTTDGVGAYLLVFPYSARTCYEYSHSARRSVSCDSMSQGGISPGEPGAVTKITYRDGQSCTILPPARLEIAYKAFNKRLIKELGRPKVRRVGGRAQFPAAWIAHYRRLVAAFDAREHITAAQFQRELGGVPQCPPVGWVATRGPRVTRADVATPVVVRRFPTGNYGCPNKLKLPQGCNGVFQSPTRMVPIEWSFEARRAVTSSRSWYEWSVSSPTGHGCEGGGSSFSTYTNIHKGQELRYSQFFQASCHGTYSIVVGFTPSAPPGEPDDQGGGFPGRDGSLIVGRATFTVR